MGSYSKVVFHVSKMRVLAMLVAIAFLAGCGGGGGGISNDEEEPDPAPVITSLDIQLTAATVYPGAELTKSTYVRDDDNQAVVDETIWNIPKVESRRLFLTLDVTQDCCRVVDIEVKVAGTSTTLDVIESPEFNLSGDYSHVFGLDGEHVDEGLQLQVTVDPDDEIRQKYDGSSDVTIGFNGLEFLDSAVFKIVLVPIIFDDHTFEEDDIDEEDLITRVREILPLSSYEVSVREAWTEEIEVFTHPSEYAGKLWREESGRGEYYYGLSEKLDPDVAGVAPYPTATRVDKQSQYLPTRSQLALRQWRTSLGTICLLGTHQGATLHFPTRTIHMPTSFLVRRQAGLYGNPRLWRREWE